MVLTLDREVISKKILPDLTKKYFSNGNTSNYKVVVRDSDDRILFSNAQADLIEPDCSRKFFNLFPSDDSRLLNDISAFEKIGFPSVAQMPGNDKENPKTSQDGSKSKAEDIKLAVTDMFGSVESERGGIWTLNIQHVSGSLEQFVTTTRQRNLAISFGILSILAAGMAIIFFSAQRAKALAKRQLGFVSSVSHEFRTPLSVVYSAGENLSDGVIADEENVTYYGNLIKREGKKLSDMVEQILEFAGARSGKRKYTFEKLDVSKLAKNVLSEYESTLTDGGFKLEKEITKDLPKISADKKALGQAFENLISNSLKYCNGNKWLKVAVRVADESVLFEIEDKGIGISKQDRKRIFDSFYRSKNVMDEQISGNGLGLSLVKQIIDAHKGKVSVESKLGKGTKFTISLPIGA